jgi:hypothetical protein
MTVTEFPPGSNPRIVGYLATCDGLAPAQRGNDDTAWCSAFANWCLVTAKGKGTNAAWALDWAAGRNATPRASCRNASSGATRPAMSASFWRTRTTGSR